MKIPIALTSRAVALRQLTPIVILSTALVASAQQVSPLVVQHDLPYLYLLGNPSAGFPQLKLELRVPANDPNDPPVVKGDLTIGMFDSGSSQQGIFQLNNNGSSSSWTWQSALYGGSPHIHMDLTAAGTLRLFGNGADSIILRPSIGEGLPGVYVNGSKVLTETAAEASFYSKTDADSRYLRTSGSGVTVLVFGVGSSGVGAGAVALGNNADSSGDGATALGKNAYALGEGATAIGFGSSALKQNAVAMGRGSVASGDWGAIALGCSARASGEMSIALGWNSVASGPISTAIGSYTVSSAFGSTALGQNTISAGQAATAAGYYSQALGWGSLAVGDRTTAWGDKSVAIGSFTSATGLNSVAIGQNTLATRNAASAFGVYTEAAGNSQFVIGSYNLPITDQTSTVRSDNDALFIVGNGFEATPGNPVTANKRNAFVVRWNGKTEINGTLQVNATATTPGNANIAGRLSATGGVLVPDTLEAKDGVTRLQGVVILERQGDISMGTFVSGHQP